LKSLTEWYYRNDEAVFIEGLNLLIFGNLVSQYKQNKVKVSFMEFLKDYKDQRYGARACGKRLWMFILKPFSKFLRHSRFSGGPVSDVSSFFMNAGTGDWANYEGLREFAKLIEAEKEEKEEKEQHRREFIQSLHA
jgi:hypothetical protein